MTESFRYVPPDYTEHRVARPTGACDAHGCTRKTREAKPFCPTHISRMPYVRKISDRMAHREWELNEIRTSGKVPRHSILIVILEDHLRAHGTASNRRLARTLDIPLSTMDKVLAVMRKKRIIKIQINRNSYFVSLR